MAMWPPVVYVTDSAVFCLRLLFCSVHREDPPKLQNSDRSSCEGSVEGRLSSISPGLPESCSAL